MGNEEPEDKKPENEEIDWIYTDLPVSQESKSDPKNCFVASTVYGSPHAPEVETLRKFRDNILKKSELGKKIIGLYYSGWGERAAQIVEEYLPSTMPVIKVGLDYLVEKYQDKNRS